MPSTYATQAPHLSYRPYIPIVQTHATDQGRPTIKHEEVTVILILKRLHAATTVPDIKEFIGPTLKGGLLKRSGRIENVKIQRLELANNNHVEYNALVNIEPDAVALRVIKQLNRKAINGKHINIDEFQFRHWDNDRRTDCSKNLNDRRQADRRRSNLEIKDITRQRAQPITDYSQLGWSTDVTS